VLPLRVRDERHDGRLSAGVPRRLLGGCEPVPPGRVFLGQVVLLAQRLLVSLAQVRIARRWPSRVLLLDVPARLVDHEGPLGSCHLLPGLAGGAHHLELLEVVEHLAELVPVERRVHLLVGIQGVDASAQRVVLPGRVRHVLPVDLGGSLVLLPPLARLGVPPPLGDRVGRGVDEVEDWIEPPAARLFLRFACAAAFPAGWRSSWVRPVIGRRGDGVACAWRWSC